MKGLLGHALWFDPDHATASVVRHININWSVAYFVYPLGIIASCYHLANGFWTAGITWGLTVSAASQRRWGWVCTGLFAFTLGCGLTACSRPFPGKKCSFINSPEIRRREAQPPGRRGLIERRLWHLLVRNV